MLATVTFAACAWAHPGADPYTGTVTDALERFAIPLAHRRVLKERIEHQQFDELVTFEKDRIESPTYVFQSIMLMHFGKNKVCWAAERKDWNDAHVEVGKLYCSGDFCVAVPDVCGNLTQLFRRRNRIEAPSEYVELHESFQRLALQSRVTVQPGYMPPGGVPTESLPGGEETYNTVPEPSSLASLAIGLLALFVRRRRT